MLSSFSKIPESYVDSLHQQIDALLRSSSECSSDISKELLRVRNNINITTYYHVASTYSEMLRRLIILPKHIRYDTNSTEDEKLTNYFILYEDNVISYLQDYV